MKAEKEKQEQFLSEVLASEGIISDSTFNEVNQILASVEIDSIFFDEIKQESLTSAVDLKVKLPDDEAPVDIRQVLQNATLPQKIKFALLGNSTCRGLLIRDSNKMIQQFVLKNPKLQISEVEEFAKNPNLSELVLKLIANNSQWMRSYSLKCALIFNPKTPQAVSIKWVKFLNTTELRKLAKSKNVPNVVSITARKRLAESEE